jgi:ATP-dependent Lon protease
MASKLGEVIRESAQIALSWTKAHAYVLRVTDNLSTMILNDQDVHVHMLEGSIGKEGLSAGTALLSVFISLFTKTLISPDIAVTGEISLIRQVLPVSRLREKILVAHRTSIKTILVPELNTL